MTTWFLLAAAVASEVTASLSLKGALERPGLYAVGGRGYVAACTFLALVLRRVLSSLIFGEALTGLMGVGIALIIAGVLAVELGSQQAQRARRATEASEVG